MGHNAVLKLKNGTTLSIIDFDGGVINDPKFKLNEKVWAQGVMTARNDENYLALGFCRISFEKQDVVCFKETSKGTTWDLLKIC